VPSLPVWTNDTCPADVDGATAYFEVPRSGGTEADFYRLPFPNDVRKRDGKVDLTGHPVPPSDLGVPLVERFVQAAGDSLTGFATNPVIFFRFSEAYDSSTTSLSGTTLRIIDITKSSPEYDRPSSLEWGPQGVESNYICGKWLAMRPIARRHLAAPLRSNTTYAAIVTRGVKPKDGGSFVRSADFDAMLAAQPPGDAVLAAAYTAYAPLREWLTDTGTSPDSLLNAAVFTTQDAEGIIPKLREAVEDSGAPTVKDLVVCGDGVQSPCEDETGRGACHSENPAFTEIHGRITLPIFQKGTPPYEAPEDGGEIELDANGAPIKQGDMDVCFALSVPKQPMPANGYPVMIYAHGTGGSFSGQLGQGGLAEEVSEGPTPSALLAIDLPEHGSRRGESTRAPEDLFFNFANPQAARGNVLQGSADLMSLTLWVADGVAAGDSPTGDAIAFDTSRVLVMGHSQGATHTALMLPYEARAQAGVLSGVGGHLATSLRLKEKPVDVGAVLPFVLFDNDEGELAGDEFNPALALIQSFFESADPINYARSVAREPTTEAPAGHHLFMTYGMNDSYSPEDTQEAYLRAGGFSVVAPVLDEGAFDDVPSPLRDNATIDTTLRTVGARQYDAGGLVDGHFVATGTPDGRADLLRFVNGFLDGQMPQIGE
jgi:hypothetical protein